MPSVLFGRAKRAFDAILDGLPARSAGAITSSAQAQVGGTDKIFDLQMNATSTPQVEGTVTIVVTAITVTTADQIYQIEVQLSASPTFASGIVINAVQKLGHATATGASVSTTVGTFKQTFTNEYQGTTYRYLRLYTRIAGTVSPSIDYSATLTKDRIN